MNNETNSILGPGDLPPAEVLNPDGKASCLLVCDHASSRIPPSLGDLGLEEEQLKGHWALDIGAGNVVRHLSELLDAPAVLAAYTRMVVDTNRRVDHPTAFPETGEGKPIPGNIGLTEEQKQQRIAEVYDPYHARIKDFIDGFLDRGVVPLLLSVHSFTPVFFRQRRQWDMGMLWTQDPRFPKLIIRYFSEKGYRIGDNEPYDARMLRGATLHRHGDERRLPNALIEIRNNYIDTDEGARNFAQMIADCLTDVLADGRFNSYYEGPLFQGFDSHVEDNYFVELARLAQLGENDE